MKKLLIALLCVTLLFCGAACGKTAQTPETTTEIDGKNTGNPFIDCATLEEAAAIAGFDLTVPDKIDGYPEVMIQAVKDEMIQVFYTDADANEILIRKGLGENDISGDYNHYDNQIVKWVGDQTVNFRGNGELMHVAYWITKDNAYSFSVSNGMAMEKIEALIPTIQ
jgi:hypothetical protein